MHKLVYYTFFLLKAIECHTDQTTKPFLVAIYDSIIDLNLFNLYIILSTLLLTVRFNSRVEMSPALIFLDEMIKH